MSNKLNLVPNIFLSINLKKCTELKTTFNDSKNDI